MWLPEFLRDLRVPTISHHIHEMGLIIVVWHCSHCIRNSTTWQHYSENHVHPHGWKTNQYEDVKMTMYNILAEGAIALSVTLSGGALFASWKLLQFPSSLIVKVILAIFSGASAQQSHEEHVFHEVSRFACLTFGIDVITCLNIIYIIQIQWCTSVVLRGLN